MRGNSGVVASQDLGSYRLSKTLQRVLGDFDRLCEYTRKGLASPPPLVRLFRRDYVAIDDAASCATSCKPNPSTAHAGVATGGQAEPPGLRCDGTFGGWSTA
jgi:hypothetical protein